MINKDSPMDWIENKILNYDYSQGMAQMRKYIQQAKDMQNRLMVKMYYDGKSEGEHEAKQATAHRSIAFHNWMKENDTADNAERFFHYTDEDMYNEFISETTRS